MFWQLFTAYVVTAAFSIIGAIYLHLRHGQRMKAIPLAVWDGVLWPVGLIRLSRVISKS